MSTADRPPHSENEKQSSGIGTTAAGIGAAVLAIVCCAGPFLLAAGALGAVGGFLRNPLVIASGIVLAAGAVTLVVRRRRTQCRPSASPRPNRPKS